MANKSFEVVHSSLSGQSKKYIIIGAAAVAAVFILILIFRAVFGGTDPAPAPPPAQAQTSPSAQAQPAAVRPGVQVVAKDPAMQAEVNQQLEQLRYFIANPTMDDANITVQWLSQRYNQTPEVVVRDLLILIERLQPLSDTDLANFFNSDQNPWREDQGYNSIIKFISYREYLEFVKKCAALYQTQR
jgi:hypothetical protein